MNILKTPPISGRGRPEQVLKDVGNHVLKFFAREEKPIPKHEYRPKSKL